MLGDRILILNSEIPSKVECLTKIRLKVQYVCV